MLSHALHASFADSAEQRVSDRRVLKLAARVATPEGEGGIEVRNLSRSGLLLESITGIETGSFVEVELPGGTRHRAEVVWADETLFGCRFVDPLTRAQLSAALLRAEPVDQAGPETPVLTQVESLAKLREHWDDEEAKLRVRAPKLPVATRLWMIGGLALTGWAVPAAAAWLFW